MQNNQSKKVMIFEDMEDRGSYFVCYCKDKDVAWQELVKEEPQILEQYTTANLKEVFMYKCLDCESYWVSDDVCGECGEFRLTKRQTPAYYLENKHLK